MIKLKKTFFSIIIDKSSDVTAKKSLVLTVRFWETTNSIKDRFIDLLEVDESTTEGLFELIKR